MTSLPVFVLDLHNICNQQCPYCIAQNKELQSFESLEKLASLNAIKRFFSSREPLNILLTGGEPLITPGFESFLEFLVDCGHMLSLQSNLRQGYEQFLRAVPADKTGWILTTLHSVAYERRREYAHTVQTLRGQGYPVVTKLVLDDLILEHLERLYELLVATGAGVLLSPLVLLNPGNDGVPVRRYSSADWKRIAPRINLLSAWLFFAGGFHSQGHTCRAGSQAFYGRLANGVVSGCAHSFPEHLGDIYSNSFQPETASVTCILQRCTCDFNYYSGIIKGLDDSEGFNRLRAGINRPVSLREYKDWLDRAPARPLLQLGNEEPLA